MIIFPTLRGLILQAVNTMEQTDESKQPRKARLGNVKVMECKMDKERHKWGSTVSSPRFRCMVENTEKFRGSEKLHAVN